MAAVGRLAEEEGGEEGSSPKTLAGLLTVEVMPTPVERLERGLKMTSASEVAGSAASAVVVESG